VLQQLADFGSLGVFAAFLVWQHIGMQKRMDARDAMFHERLDSMRADYDKTGENGAKLDKLIHWRESHND